MNIRNYDKTDTINIFGQLEILVILHVMFSPICGIKLLMYTSERASLLHVQGAEDKLILEKLLTTRSSRGNPTVFGFRIKQRHRH
jgi:hypothetical protein